MGVWKLPFQCIFGKIDKKKKYRKKNTGKI
jgi:hypothetical protein